MPTAGYDGNEIGEGVGMREEGVLVGGDVLVMRG